MNRHVRSLLIRWGSIPVLLLVWQVCAATGTLKSRLLPAPVAIFNAFVTGLLKNALLFNAEVTVARALAGFFLAVCIGGAIAASMSASPRFTRMIQPVFVLGYPVPKIALFPVFAFVFGIGGSSKIAFTTGECLFPIVISAHMGICGAQQKLMWAAQSMGADRLTVFRRVLVPAAMPTIFSGFRIALPLALTVVVVTEMIGDTQGLGAYITIWSTRFSYANVYAGILMVGVCGAILDRLLVYSGRWLMPWASEPA